jgi:hypothetical protein
MIGSELKIDDNFLKILEKVDKRYSDLIDKNNTFSKSAVEAFSRITKDGIDPFLNKLQQQRDAFKAIATIDLGEKPSAAMKKLANEATKAVDDINKLLVALQGVGTSKDTQRANKTVTSEINKETNAYLKSLDAQIKARQEYLTRQETVEKERVRITQEASKQVEKEIQKENDAYLKSLEIKIKAAQEQQLRNEQIRSQRESISNKAKEQVEREIKSENDAYLRGLSERIKQEQEYQLRNEKIKEERKRIEAEATKFVEKEIQKEKDAHLKSLSEQIKARQEYLSRMQRIQEAQAKRESQMRANQYKYIQKIGDTSGQANAAYNRLYSSQGVKSINNMNNVLQKLRDAQNKLNLATDSGKKKYEELGKKIQNIEKDLKKLSDSQDKFSKGQSRLMNTSDQLQRKLALVFSVSAIQGYVNKLIEVRKEFELQQKSLQVLLKDKDEADKLWQQTLDLAVKSPFRVKELVNYTKQLAAYRIETSKLHQTTKMLSDVSAGLGVDMQRIILAFGQVRAAQFLRGTELRQFTEAGIPMLDELSNLFTELEGRFVSTGEVFERISKRMVLFKDVEKVFERMTSESGIFYKMQEEQSKTLAGMISNLHDSMDIMMNDIGKSNEKNIKGLIQITRTMIDNWRMVGVVIKESAAAFLLFNLSKFAHGWRMASGAMTMADVTMKGIAGTAGKLRVALSTLITTIASNPFTAIFAALAAAGYAVWEYSESIDAVNKKYDEMSIREVNVIDKLEALNEKSKEYNTIIKNNKKDSEERNNAEKENLKILKEIKTKYPELVNLVSKQTDGTIDLTKAIEAQNEKLIENIALQQKAKGGWFYDSLDENYKDAIEEFTELQSEINSIKVISAEAMSKLSQADISTEDYKKFSSLLAEIRKSKDFDSLKVAYYNFTQEVVRNGKEVTKQVPLLGMFAKQWLNVANAAGSYKQSIKDLKQSFERQKDDIFVGITDAYNKVFSENAHEPYDEANEAGAKAAGAWIEGFLDDFGIIDENIREWAKIEIPKFVTVDVIYAKKEDIPQELEPWAKRVKEAITKVNDEIKTKNKNAKQFDLFPLPDPGQTREQYLNIAKSVLDIAKATYAEGQQIEDEATVNRTKMLSDYADDVERILNIIKKETTKSTGKDWLSEVVKSLKEAHQEYIKLNKTLGESESKQMALDKYAKSFAESAKNAGLKDISLGQFKFETEEGAIEALTFLKNKLPQSAKQARFKLEEAIGEIRGEVRMRTKAEDDKFLIEEIEDMFSGYEMSIELKKLNIPKDLAKQLFNIDSLTLPDLRDKIKSMESKFIGTEMEEEYRKYLKKIDEMEDKEQKERLKKYVKYMLQAQSERVKIKIDEMNQLSEIEKLNVSELDKNLMRQGVREETQKKLDKAAWEDFKNSDMYIRIFEDLDRASSKALSAMQDKLVELRGSLSELSPENLKEIVRLEEKIAKVKIDKNPFAGLITSIKNLSSARKELNKLEEKHGFTYEEGMKTYEEQKNKIDELQISIKKLTDEYGADTPNAVFEKENLETLKKANKELAEILDKMGLLYSKTTSSKLGIKDSFAGMADIFEQAAQSTTELADAFDKIHGLNATQRDTFETISGVFSGMGGIMRGAEKIASGNPFAIVAGGIEALGGIASVVGEIFAIGDKKKERQIQREIKLVEDLERAYAKLEKAIDSAYSINTLQESGKAAKQNLEEQINSYEKMIAAEEDKKKTDDDRIKEWQLAIEDLTEQKAELDKQLVSTATGGIMDDVLSAAQEFTNAWLEAFNETGDGLSGLEDNFKETMLEMVKQQAAMLISQSYIEKWKEQLKQYINPDDLELSTNEAKKWVDAVTTSLPQLNQALENYFTAMQQAGVDVSGGQGELSGLQRGIQGVTEETAQIIEAYLNSIRFFVAEQNTYLSQIAASFGNTEVENPMVEQLRIIAAQTSAINSLLQGLVRGGHTLGGTGLKVFIS